MKLEEKTDLNDSYKFIMTAIRIIKFSSFPEKITIKINI